ncbi:hypothetical protein AYO20_11504 [Fonsecaea nubica]|uniref:Uncharacterized protein n=1 Tax=Fonsecaea nubica TaxID=856822 RepID=A0A178BUI1_9EURO|nr:hypothetical protein AYO20_11504 [Fonsecaea nubica]OAL20353.1 hypothetical protein AYO20_11504 [Fonsecaea nubica]
MGGGPKNPEASPCLKTVGASSQSPPCDENDARHIESRENTEADDTDDETASPRPQILCPATTSKDCPATSEEASAHPHKSLLLSRGHNGGNRWRGSPEAPKEKAEQEASHSKEDNKDSNPDPEAAPTSVDETPDDTQQAAPIETAPEETASKKAEAGGAFEEITHEGEEADRHKTGHEKISTEVADENADVALDEAAVTQQESAQDKTKSQSKKKPKTKLPVLVEFRELDDQSLDKKGDISKEEYTRCQSKDPSIGRIYHYLAILAQPRTRISPDEQFHATVSHLFYYTKSLVVKAPVFAARESVSTLIKPIVARNEEEAEKLASDPQTDKDHFLTAVSHLILASLEPEILRGKGCKDRRNDHLQTVYAALKKIKIGASATTSRSCPRYVPAL